MITVRRWICTCCFLTFSVIPDEVLPYRSISSDRLEQFLDHVCLGQDPPTCSEKEKGCLKRALKSFIINIPFLTNRLGQIIEMIHPSAAQLWLELRRLGDMREILFYLAKHFKTSLLKDYLCLRSLVRGEYPRKSVPPKKPSVPQTC